MTSGQYGRGVTVRGGIGNRAVCTLLGLFVAVLAMFFHQHAGANANSRMMLVLALVEDGTHVADRWADATVDKAVIDGHAYCDKAPLASYVVAPLFALWRLGGGPLTEADVLAGYHIAVAATGAVPLAIWGVLILRRLQRDGPAAGRGGVWLASLAVFGTFVFVYGGIYLGHCLAGALLVGSYVLAVERGRRYLLAGFLGGCSGLAEYPAILFQIVIVAGLGADRRRRSGVARYLLGAAPAAAYLFAYNAIITGSPWDFPYRHAINFPAMADRAGVAAPSAEALWGLLSGLRRGVFAYAPALIVLIPMLLRGDGDGRVSRIVALAGFVVQLLFLSSYAYWDGGWATGPRFLTAGVMLVVYAGCAAIRLRPRWANVCLVLLAVGMLVSLAAAATDPIIDDRCAIPMTQWIWPRVLDGAANPQNLAHEWGLPNGVYLIGLWLAAWGAGTWALATRFGAVHRRPVDGGQTADASRSR